MRDGFALVDAFPTPEMAHIARSAIEAAGIECYVANENVVRLDFFWSQAMGGVKLFVPEADLERAREILLTEAQPEASEAAAFLDEKQMCPACGSRRVRFVNEATALTKAAFFFCIPLPFFRKTWRCNECRHEWKEKSAA